MAKLMKRKSTKNNNKIINLTIGTFGWISAVLVVAAYALSSFSVLPTTSISYILMNLVGAIGLLVVSVKNRNYQTVLTNAVWLIVALIGISSFITAIISK